MITPVYASLLILLIIYLSFKVIGIRHKKKIKYSDQNDSEIIIARTAQSNCLEYSILFLILLSGLELNHTPAWILHILGLTFLIGRLAHAKSVLSDRLKGRVLGMQITFGCLILCCLGNMGFYIATWI